MHGELQRLINDWRQEAARLLLKSKTDLDSDKAIGYYAAYTRVLICCAEVCNVVKSVPSDEEIDNTFPLLDAMPEKGKTYNAGKRLGAKWMRKKLISDIQSAPVAQ